MTSAAGAEALGELGCRELWVDERVLVEGVGAALGAAKEGGASLDSDGTCVDGIVHVIGVGDATGGDERQVDGARDSGDEVEGSEARLVVGDEGAAVGAGFDALEAECVGAAGCGLASFDPVGDGD